MGLGCWFVENCLELVLVYAYKLIISRAGFIHNLFEAKQKTDREDYKIGKQAAELAFLFYWIALI